MSVTINTLRGYAELGLSEIHTLKGICGKASTPDGSSVGIYSLLKYKPEALSGESSPTLEQRQANNYSLIFSSFGTNYMNVFQSEQLTENSFRDSWKWGYSFNTSSYPSRLADWEGYQEEGIRDIFSWEDVGYVSESVLQRRGIPGGYLEVQKNTEQINMNVVTGSDELVSITDLPFFRSMYLGLVGVAQGGLVYFYANGSTIGDTRGRQLSKGSLSIEGAEIFRLFPVVFSTVESSMVQGWVRTTGTYGGSIYSINGTFLRLVSET